MSLELFERYMSIATLKDQQFVASRIVGAALATADARLIEHTADEDRVKFLRERIDTILKDVGA